MRRTLQDDAILPKLVSALSALACCAFVIWRLILSHDAPPACNGAGGHERSC